jgi:WD40 repeat protein
LAFDRRSEPGELRFDIVQIPIGFPMIRQISISILVLSCAFIVGCAAAKDARVTDSTNIETPSPTTIRTQTPAATFASPSSTPNPTISPTPKPRAIVEHSIGYDFENNPPGLPDGAIARLGDGYIADVAVSSNRQYLAVAAGVGFYIYRLPSLELHWFIPAPRLATFVTFSPDSTTLKGGGIGFELLWDSTWDVATGERTSEVFTPASNSWIVYDVMYSSDGTMYAERGSSFGMQAVIVVVSNSQTGNTFFTSGDVWQMAFSPDSTRLALAFMNGTIEIQDPLEEEQTFNRSALSQFQVPITGPITDMSWSPDSQTMIVVAAHTAWLFDVQSQELLHEFDLPEKITSAGWSADGHHILLITSSQVSAWNARTYDQSWQTDASGSIDYVDRERIILLSADWQFTVLSAETGEILSQKQEQRPGYAAEIAYSPDGKWIAAASPYLGVVLYDAATYAYTQALHADLTTVTTISWSPDSATIAAGYEDGAVVMWDIATGDQTDEWLADPGITSVAWSPDGSLLAVHASGESILSSSDDALAIYDVTTHTQIDRFSVVAGCCDQSSLNWSPDSEALAVRGNQTVVWYRDSRESIATNGPVLWSASGEPWWVNLDTSQVLSFAGDVVVDIENHLAADQLAVSPDYLRLANASDLSGMINVYDMTTGMRLSILFRHTAEVLDIAWSPDSTRLISSSRDGTILVWEAP